MATSTICIICGNDEGSKNVVGEKGLKTLMKAATTKSMTELVQMLKDCRDGEKLVYVHHECRRKLTDLRKKPAGPEPKKLRSSSIEESFSWKLCCFLCTKLIVRHKERFHQVQTLPLHKNIMECAKIRNDTWGEAVLTRLGTSNDLVAEEAIYHNSCMADFKLNKVTDCVRGRPEDPKMTDAFESICYWLENVGESEIYSVKELYDQMIQDNGGVGYCLKSFRTKLKLKYEDHVHFIQSTGNKGELVCFRNMADYILRIMKEEGKSTKESVVKAAAKIAKEEIREMDYDNKMYPGVEDILAGENWVPESLHMFMKLLVPSSKKQLSLSQCIIQAARPRSIIAPIPFGVSVNIDKSTGCKQLIQHFSRLGFSVTPDELYRFKQSAIDELDKDVNDYEEISNGFNQWVSDNVDHNIATLTGKGTFHGMGIIQVGKMQSGTFGRIPRKEKRAPAMSFIKSRGIEIVPYQKLGQTKQSKLLPMSTLKGIRSIEFDLKMSTYDFLWHASWFMSSPEQPRPNWSGFLQCSTTQMQKKGSQSHISFLPIIDLNPSNESCIYSTLLFIISQAKRFKVDTPCVTFDQPLWLKAFNIIKTENLQIVCRLGGFHTLMSFMGSIGVLMNGSGLEDLFAEVYAENSVIHMMSGKAIARATRAHILAESALTTILVEMIIEGSGNICIESLQPFYQSACERKLDDESLEKISKDSHDIIQKLKLLKSQLEEKSRTSALWLLYMNYIQVVKEFIYAERTSNWELHLDALSKMLHLFAATGHINYAKSARLYLQEMRKLPETHPWLYQQFMDGNHTVQRTERNWTGIWTDLAIEQTMMRSIKSRGGLTGGRGMTESVRHIWTLSLSAMASIHDAMSQLTGVSSKSSEQHEEIGKSRRNKDFQDCKKFLDWLNTRNPFCIPDENLYSLSTCIISSTDKDNVNCEKAEEVGKQIQTGLDNVFFHDAKIKRKDQLINLHALQQSKSIGNKEETTNPTLMFNRLITVAAHEEDLEPFFEFELTYEPMSLFKQGMMRDPDKPSLRKVIMSDINAAKKEEMGIPDSYVLDGGALLHRVRWFKGMTFNAVAAAYSNYIRKHYAGKITVVFDGYEDEGTKSHEHLRRNSIPQSCMVDIHKENPVPFTQDRFLSNTENKANFVKFLSNHLKQTGFDTVDCPGDADSTIVKTGLEIARMSLKHVTVVADDTDIAVLLVHHWEDEMADIFFLQERWNKSWSIKNASLTNKSIKNHLLFIHSWSGCDTVSSVYGKGKSRLPKLMEEEKWQLLSEVISSPRSSQAEVGSASIQAFVLLYGGKEGDTLRKLR